MELNPDSVVVIYHSGDAPNLMSASSSILQTVAPIIHQPADIAISAQNVDNVVIYNPAVTQEREKLLRSFQPKYLQYNT